MQRNASRVFALAALVALTGLPTASPAADPLTYEAVFDPQSLLRVEITMAPADWEALSTQTRSMITALARDRHPDSAEKPFSWFPADVKVNGVTIPNVGVRKKGFIGSLDRDKPSLKVDFKRFEKGRRVAGLKQLTLNNNKQDPAAINQFLAYKFFRDAGLPAARANHALVTVNGETLGIYSHVESIDDMFLERRFEGKTGTLYEGTITDFVDGWADKFETKRGGGEDYADVRKVVAALATDDDRLLAELDVVLDLKQFYRFWASEVLLSHWDGYAGNRNNFFIYRPRGSDRFVFLPWGMDHIADRHPFWQFTPPASVYAGSSLTRRLYQHPQGREQYRAALRELVEQVWNEKELLGEVDRIEKLTGEHLPKTEAVTSAYRRVREFIAGRREAVLAELNGPAPQWTWPLTEPMSVTKVGTVSGTFKGQWGTLMGNPFAPSEVTLDLQLGDQRTTQFAQIGATAGESQQPNDRGNSAVRIMASREGSPKLQMVGLSVNPRRFKPGVLDLDMTTVSGVVLEIDPSNGGFKFQGLLQGTVTFTETGMEKDAAVAGSFEGEIVGFSGME
jgi:spore coat protein H